MSLGFTSIYDKPVDKRDGGNWYVRASKLVATTHTKVQVKSKSVQFEDNKQDKANATANASSTNANPESNKALVVKLNSIVKKSKNQG